MDRRDLESGSRLHQDQPRLRPLRFAERFRGVKGHAYEQGFDLRLVPEKLTDPFTWTVPRKVFVNSMSDLFHEDVPDGYVLRVADVMRHADWHIFQVLSKRSERMHDLLCGRLRLYADLPHIWWGVSVENRKHGVPRVDHLRRCPARVRWLSIEPLLDDLGDIDLQGIHWVVVGGESGPGARAMDVAWARSIRDQCGRAKIPFFSKQWGGPQKGRTDPRRYAADHGKAGARSGGQDETGRWR